MNTPRTRPEPSPLLLGAGAILCVLAVLGAVVWLTGSRLERHIRQQIVDRDAYSLHSVFTMHMAAIDDLSADPAAVKDPLHQLNAVLETSRLKGVIAARLYSPSGAFLAAFPTNVTPGVLPPLAHHSLAHLAPASLFLPDAALQDIFDHEPDAARVPLVRICVPIHDAGGRDLDGIAEFILDGQPVATQYATLSHRLIGYSAGVFILASLVIVLTVGWAVRRLALSNQALAARTAELLRANEELTLAAKTSAIGSVAAHLVHGLRNPLAGLQNFVAAKPSAQTHDSDWELAADAAARMRRLIDEVVRVLTEEQAISAYEISASELASVLRSRVAPLASNSAATLEITADSDLLLPNREANIVLLVLQNLIKNAIDCTPRDSAVRVALFAGPGRLFCEVVDQGPGLPDHVRAALFRPVRSTKPDGAGIGLAICKQLASHIGADIAVKCTSAQGTVFTLSVPAQTQLKVA